MKIYEIYSLIRTRCQGKKEKKEIELYDGPYYCPESAKEEMEVLNQVKKSTKHIVKDRTTIHTSFQVIKRDADDTEKDQYLQEEWELAQEEIEEKEEEKKKTKQPLSNQQRKRLSSRTMKKEPV